MRHRGDSRALTHRAGESFALLCGFHENAEAVPKRRRGAGKVFLSLIGYFLAAFQEAAADNREIGQTRECFRAPAHVRCALR